MRVHELAKELKLTSKDAIEKLKSLKVDVKNHMSVLTAENIAAIKASLDATVPPAVKKTFLDTRICLS